MCGGRGRAKTGISLPRGSMRWLLALGCLLIHPSARAGNPAGDSARDSARESARESGSEQIRIASLSCSGNALISTPQILKGFSTHAGGVLDPDLFTTGLPGGLPGGIP